MNPKVMGALSLHIALQDRPLDFLICLSSMIGIVGFPNESVYGASNVFLDALCRLRGTQGLPVASISLPAISDIGYFAEKFSGGDRKRTNNQFGISMTRQHLNFAVQAACEREFFNPENNNHTTLGHTITTQLMSRAMLKTPLLAHIRNICSDCFPDQKIAVRNTNSSLLSMKESLASETSWQDSLQTVANAIITRIASTHNLSAEAVTLETKLSELNFDSLDAVKFRNWIQTEFDAKIPLLDLVDGGSLEHLVARIMRLSAFIAAEETGNDTGQDTENACSSMKDDLQTSPPVET